MNDHDHNVEYAAAGRPIEFADARSDPASAALRNAPAWVRERLAEIPSQAGSDTVVERRGGMEFASEDRATASLGAIKPLLFKIAKCAIDERRS